MSLNDPSSGSKVGERSQLVGGGNPTRVDYTKARNAFRGGDIESSREAHDDPLPGRHDDFTVNHADTLKAGVFGALDGILTSFAIVAGAAGGGLSSGVILILGVSNMIADGLSMGLGEYLSAKAMNEYIDVERQREEWELKNHRQGEIDEMVELYTQRGMAKEDAKEVLQRLSKYDRFFVNVMMAEELGLPTYAAPLDEGGSVREGLLMFISFALAGILPLIGYALSPMVMPGVSRDELFLVACLITGVSLFIVGGAKSHFSARSWFASGLETLILGGCCAGLAYEIGAVVSGWVEGME